LVNLKLSARFATDYLLGGVSMIIEYMEKYTGPDRGSPKKKVSRGDSQGQI